MWKQNGSWVWYDGSVVVYGPNWVPGEPDRGDYCARLAPSGWGGRDCGYPYRYFCKRRE